MYNKYNSSYQLANINGFTNFSLGLIPPKIIYIESPIKLDELDQKKQFQEIQLNLKNPVEKEKANFSPVRKKTEEKEIEKNAY